MKTWTDRRLQGIAMATCAYALLSVPVSAVPVNLTQESSAFTFTKQVDAYNAGDSATTLVAPLEAFGNVFTHWTIGGVRQAGVTGASRNPVVFQILGDETAVAQYLWSPSWSPTDADSDGVLDWFELRMNGNLTMAPTDDADNDGVNFAAEFRRGTHPAISNRIDQGGITARDSAAANFIFNTNFVEITEVSDPAGLIPTRTFVAEIGSTGVTTMLFGPAPGSTDIFTYWGIGSFALLGPKVPSTLGPVSFPLPAAVFTVTEAITLTANFYPDDVDTEPDGVENWFELATGPHDAPFPVLFWNGQTDFDVDGASLSEEYVRGTHPLISNRVDQGGICMRDSSMFPVNPGQWPALTMGSQPTGIVPPQQVFAPTGTMVVTPLAPLLSGEHEFIAWELGESRAEHPSGVPYNPLPVVLWSNLSAVAQYGNVSDDIDLDGLPDVYEIGQFDSLAFGPGDNNDGDAFDIGDEFRHGFSPHLTNAIEQGGVAARDSVSIGVDLRFFPVIQDVLVDGTREAFFGADPETPGTFQAVNGWSHPALGDWDGDGDLDLFVGSKVGGMRIFENAGSPVFMNLIDRTANFGALASAWTNIGIPHPTLGDWDQDGTADLAIGSTGGEVVFVQSTGHFGTNQVPGLMTNLVLSGVTNVSPAIGPFRESNLMDLALLKDNGEVELILDQSGDTFFPLEWAQSAPNILETTLLDAWSVSGPGPSRFSVVDDLFVSDERGQIWQYQGQSFSYSPVSKVYGGTYEGFATRLTVSMGDIDGDGDDDVMCGSVDGGLMLLRNNEPKLALSPPAITLVSGDSVGYEVLGTTGSFIFGLYENNSGGSIHPLTGLYTAGPTDGVTDIIRVIDRDSVTFGLAYANVISAADVTQAGKAIVVAGGKSFDDPVWLATDHVADFAYKTLLFRGFSKANLQYLSFDPDQDADGNGLLDDIGGFSSFANVENAFTNFALNADKLFVYMANHGSDSAGLGFFRLNAAENLSATNVAVWLDALQDANTNLCVTVVLDFCYSGSFVDELAYTGTAKRIVIASAADDELTYFIAGGLVSFSDVFFSALLQGLDLETAYLLAADAMSAYQNGQLDDDKDGSYVPGQDGDIAAGIIPGASFLVGRDVPVIGEISPSQVITGATAFVYADDVSSAYPIDRVWCSIISPSHGPNTNAGVPVVDVPEAELFYNSSTRRYEATLEGFTEQGGYQVNIHAEDIWGGVSFPRQTVVTQSGFDERIIIAVGGPSTHPRYAGMKSVAQTAYQTALSRQFSHDKIYFMMPDPFLDVDGDGTNDVDSGITQVDVDFAFLSFATAADRLTVLMIGDTTNGQFQIEGGMLGAGYLDGHLDSLQTGDQSVNVVLEFDDSGAWPPMLLAPSGKERIVIASTRADRKALLSADGFVSFSQFFLSEIFQGKTIGAATATGRRTIRRASGRLRQRPGIDDDGDGVVNEKNVDGVLASGRYIGPAFLTGDDIPFIGNPMPPAVALSNTVTLWASDVLDVDGISNVWVVVTPPDFDDSESPPVVPLSYSPGNSRFEASSGMFTNLGLYVLTFYATDNLGQLSAAVQSTVTRTDNPYAVPDAFEPDDTSGNASLYQQAQQHSFHVSNDCDWVRVYLLTNFVYDIETIHHGDTIDTVLDVYRENLDGSLTLIDSVDDFGFDDGELTGLDFPASGWYLVKVTSFHDLGFEPGAYTLIIDIPAGNGAFVVMAVDALNGSAIAGAAVRVDGGAPVSFAGQTALALNLAAGGHSLEIVTNPGYVPVESTVESGQVNNPTNPVYGNPRVVSVADVAVGSAGFSAFAYFPVIEVMGHVEDATTSVDVVGASLAFEATNGETAGTTYDRYPYASTYGTLWQTAPGGVFPGSLRLIAGHDYQATVWSPLHFTSSVPVNISGLAPGASFDLGTIALVPDPAQVPVDLYPYPGPDWWYAQSVVSSNLASGNDFAAVNQGQLKALASAAALAIAAEHAGTTPAISNMVNSFTQNGNFSAVNAGQAKHVASAFYDWLIAEGELSAYPWTGAPQTNDHALINAGQLKFLFSFPIPRP